VLAADGCWIGIGRVEPPAARREREQVTRELPHVVQLLGAALAAGAAPVSAIEAVTEAAPGPTATRLAAAAARLRLGAEPGEVWSDLARAPSFGPLGRTLARAHGAGAPVAVAIERLAQELARASRADVESRARAVGVKAAVPLGVCLLPCFLLTGVVPLAAALLTSLTW
jgi:Flp pilus assembly protein TadB